MKIPLGNFGNSTPGVPNVPRVSNAQGMQRIADVGMQIAGQLIDDQRALNRAKAANDFHDYKIAVHTAGLELAGPLADGSLSAADAPEEYKKRIEAIPRPDASYADEVTAENVSRGVGQVQAEGNNSIIPLLRNAQVLEQKTAVDLGLDKIGKLASMPGNDPMKELAALAAYDQQGMVAYGKNWAAKKQEFIDKAWFDVGLSRLQQNSANKDALTEIKKDLANTTSGSYADKLDNNKRLALIAQADQYIHGVQVDENNARIVMERETKKKQDEIMQGYLTRTVAGTLKVSEVLDNRILDFPQKEHMINIITAGSKGHEKTDSRLFGELFQRIHLPADNKRAITHPDELYPYVGKGLSVTDMAKLRAEVDGKNQPEGELLKNFKTMAQAQISGSTIMFGKDPAGEDNFYKWLAYFSQEFQAKRKAGKSAHELLDPASPDYMGSTINGFKRDFNQQTKDYVDRFKSGQALLPAKNAKGWTLQTDAKGNKAYVSPDGKQFEEIK